MLLKQFHQQKGGVLFGPEDQELVLHYGNPLSEYSALTQAVGLIDGQSRSRLCLIGNDRQRFLNGQVTNNVRDLQPGGGCYAALVNHKGKIQSDLNIHLLENEILLDFEPGCSHSVKERLEKFIIADDVQVVDASPAYTLFSLQGPATLKLLAGLPGFLLSATPYSVIQVDHPGWGEVYLVNHARLGTSGADVYVPVAAASSAMEELSGRVLQCGGSLAGFQAWELARIEAGIPRFGADMDETNLAPEAGLEQKAISYNKGCYTGQEVIARIRTYGQVAKTLRGLVIPGETTRVPARGEKLWREGKEAGYWTSAVYSTRMGKVVGLGYVRKEFKDPGQALSLKVEGTELPVTVASLPFNQISLPTQ